MRETEIRPDSLMAEQERRWMRDVERMLSRKADFVCVPCPACGEEARWLAPPTLVKFLSFRECPICGTLYATPRPTPEILADYYKKSENMAYWNTHIFPASENARRERLFRPRVERLIELLRTHDPSHTGGTLVEVGAGFGTFLEEARSTKRFDRLVAVEPTPDLAATCRRRGLEVIETPFEKLAPLLADVIASFETIEHLFSPIDFARAAYWILRPGGFLVLTCPNWLGFDVQELREKSTAVDNEHLNLFHPESMRVLLTRVGFDVLEVTTPGKLDAELVRKAVLVGKHELASPFLQRVLIDDWDRLGTPFQQFLADHGFSSHMWTVARRP